MTLAACTPNLAGSAAPGPGWPDLADPPIGRLDGRADAALIVAIDDPERHGRAGAWEVASGWWRYLVQTRGLRQSRVRLLRGEAASAWDIADAVADMKHQADAGSMLWLIFIGGADSPIDGGDGRLHAGDGSLVELAPLRQELSFGYHESAFMLLDACAAPRDPTRRAGIPASVPLPPPPPRPDPKAEWRYEFTLGGLAAAAARASAQIAVDVAREQTAPRNAFVLTAGTGDACATQLAGRPWPALAYAALGGLQGWSDIDEDGWVAARELAVYAQSLLADPPTSKLEAGGVDVILADVAGFAPRPARVARHRRHAQPLAPGLAQPSDASLREAASLVDLQLEDMVAVPDGRFVMGCDETRDQACERDEYPPHEVALHGFAIDRTEVTWAAYRECLRSGACEQMRLGACWVWSGKAFVRGAELPAQMLADDHPVVCVDWSEAQRYCKAVGKRLPTEAEWERAARGIDRRVYPWGDEPPTCQTAASHGCSDFTRPIASHPQGASPVGALDMAGNVGEWVFDWWHEASYRRTLLPNPSGPETGEVRAVRGGSFYDGEIDVRSGYRYGLDPAARTSTIGFRCVR